MSTKDDLVRAIVASPGDVTLRLAYADYLEEFCTDDPVDVDRARLIRIDQQVSAGVPAETACALYDEKHRIVGDRWGRNAERPFPEYAASAAWPHGLPVPAHWSRWYYGFPYRARIHAYAFESYPDRGMQFLIRAVRDWPLLSVDVTGPDEPTPNDPTCERPHWVRTDAYRVLMRSRLPEPIFEELRDWTCRTADREGATVYLYDTNLAALRDLDRAVVRAARKGAGLPEAELDVPIPGFPTTRKKGAR